MAPLVFVLGGFVLGAIVASLAWASSAVPDGHLSNDARVFWTIRRQAGNRRDW